MSTIKSILTKIHFHPSCYFLLLLSAFSANFLIVILIISLLFIHELGHFITAHILGFETISITFYPFGGVSKFFHDLNCPIKHELLVLLMGPIFQTLFYLFLTTLNCISSYLDILKSIHYSILLFNLLPIYPLDGGRIFQCLSCYFISYNASFKFIYLISIIFIILFLIAFYLNPTLNLLLIIILLIIKLCKEYKNAKYYFERFILERYLHKYNFKKSTIVTKVEDFKRDYRHLVKVNNKYLQEHEFLTLKYKKML